MRKLKFHLFAVLALLACSNLFAQQTAKITPGGIGYMEYLPQGYNSTSSNYPVVISLHGVMEKGNTLADVIKVTNVGLPKYVHLGQQYPFILISPQLKTNMGKWTGAYVMEVLNYVKTKLRIDNSRIYLTGLSLGGGGVWSVSTAYPSVFAAILPICSGYNNLGGADELAAENVATWGFHGDEDHTVSYTITQKMINAINGCTPKPKPNPLAKLTIFVGMSHAIWNKVYKDTNALDWLLSFKNGSTPTTPPTNDPPVVNAGGDKSITLPTNSVALQASASDSDGSITTYTWTKVSGGTVSLANTTTPQLSASNMVAGTYNFRLTVKDNDGATDYDDVKVVVNSTTNKLPVVSAGSDKTTSNSGITIVGSASDADGYIASYTWTKVSGPSVPLEHTNTTKLWVSNLKAGTYYFRLTVKDNKGAVRSDDMKLTVPAG